MAAWTMTDDGEFVLNEPYKTQLYECKLAGAMGYQDAAFGYLADHTQYGKDELMELFVGYATREDLPHLERMSQFIVRALEGDL